MTITAKQRLQGDFENICEMAKDDIDAALWRFDNNPALSIEALQSSIENIKTALDLIKPGASQ